MSLFLSLSLSLSLYLSPFVRLRPFDNLLAAVVTVSTSLTETASV